MADQPYRPGAGASAQARYDELSAPARRRRRIVAAVSAPLAAAVELVAFGDWAFAGVCALAAPAAVLYWQHAHDAHGTWAKGAAGERKTARLLRPLQRRGYTVLHDRSLPTGNANLDHLLIGPAGVIVVDSKNWSKKRIVKGRGRRVRVGRTWGSTIVKSTIYETGVVAGVLETATGRPVPVAAVLAVHGAKLPPWRTLSIDGVLLLPARQVRHWIKRLPGQLAPSDVAELTAICERMFPPYDR